MFDIGWTEMLVVAVIAIVFVGPKELPGMLRTFGKVIKKVRGMAGEFQGQFNDALKEAELDGLKDTFDDVRSLDPTKAIKDKLNPLKENLEKTVEAEAKKTPDKTPQEIEAEIADDYANAQKALGDSSKSSGQNAVPGFSSESKAETKPAKLKTKSKAAKQYPKAKAKRVAAKPVSKKPATKSPPKAKPGKTAGKAAAGAA